MKVIKLKPLSICETNSYLVISQQNNAVLNLRTNEGDVVAARKATTTLSVLNSVSSLSDFLFTYRSGTDYCFTSSSRITPEKLFGEQLVYSAHTAADFYATVNSPEKVSVWPVDTVRQYGGQETEYLTFFVSYTTGVHTPRQCTVFLIPASRIRSLMSRIFFPPSIQKPSAGTIPR